MKIFNNKRGAVGASTIVILVISFFLFAILGTMALNALFDTATSGHTGINSSVSATVKTVATTVVGILFAIGVAIKFIPRGKGGMAFSPFLMLSRIIEKLKSNKKAGIGVGTVVGMSVALLIFAYLGPMGFNYLAVGLNTTRIPAGSPTYIVAVTVCSILFAIGVALKFLPKGKG